MTKEIFRPNILYDNLFVKRKEKEIFDLLSKGLYSISENVKCIIEDAKILVRAKKYTRTDFLVATANEEIAKAYIILDMCRLNVDNKESILRKLCGAFYNHTIKYAYYTIYNSGFLLDDMKEVCDIFRAKIKKLWPGDEVTPDMPHDTYFTRDSNLYVDFIDYDQKWSIPGPDDYHAYKYDGSSRGYNSLTETKKALDMLTYTRDNGLFNLEILVLFNAYFKNFYFNEHKNKKDLLNLYKKIALDIENKYSITKEIFCNSVLTRWPLYYCLEKNSTKE